MAEVTTHVEKVTMTSNQQTREEILVQDDQLVDDDSILTLREKLHSNEFSDALKALETAHHRILDDYLHNFQIQLAEERRERLLAEERSKQTSIELADAIKRLDRQQETAAANEKALEKRIKQLKVTADNLMEHLKRAEERVKQAEREADEYRQKANQLELSLAEAQKPSQRSTHAGVDDNTPVEVSESTSMIGTRQNSNASESVLDTRIERERLEKILEKLPKEDAELIRHNERTYRDEIEQVNILLVEERRLRRKAEHKYEEILIRFRRKTEEWENWRRWFNSVRKSHKLDKSAKPSSTATEETATAAAKATDAATNEVSDVTEKTPENASDKPSTTAATATPEKSRASRVGIPVVEVQTPTRGTPRKRTLEAVSAHSASVRGASIGVDDQLLARHKRQRNIDVYATPKRPQTTTTNSMRPKESVLVTPRLHAPIVQGRPSIAHCRRGRTKFFNTNMNQLPEEIIESSSEEETEGFVSATKLGKQQASRSATSSAKRSDAKHNYVETPQRKQQSETSEDMCPECEKFHKAAGPVRRLPELGAPANDEYRIPCRHVHKREQRTTRQRANQKRPSTPDGMWEVDFPSTQELETIQRMQRNMKKPEEACE